MKGLSFLLFMFSSLLTDSFSFASPSNSSSDDFVQDFGKIITTNPPMKIIAPKNPKQASDILRSIFNSENPTQLKVAARGVGHSTYGQAQAPGGLIINMPALPAFITIGKDNGNRFYVDAGGGALWIDVLKEALKQGLSPRSWTDYLYLTVGGTLSNAGISGQAFKFGPQISNVLELDVITGKGEKFTCSDELMPDLFFAVLGGLGQFGIITRARILLTTASNMAKRVRREYEDFDKFSRDQELIISMPEAVDYLEGSISFKPTANSSVEGNVIYTLDFVIYYDDAKVAEEVLNSVTLELNWTTTADVDITDLSYFEFLNRVKAEEDELRKEGLWDEVAHPWLNLFVPKDQAKFVKDLILETIPFNGFNGPFLIYPTLTNKWDSRTSAVLPGASEKDDNIMYAVSVLRSAPPSCTQGSECLNEYLSQNQKIITAATARGAKQYLPYWRSETEWAAHFGRNKWLQMKELKSRFDPFHTLAPGQRMFT